MKDGSDDPIVVDREMRLDLVAQVNFKVYLYIIVHLQCLIHLIVFTRIMNALLVNILAKYVVVLYLQVQPHISSMSWMLISRNNRCVDALGVVYPQYWMQEGCNESFGKHLDILNPSCLLTHYIAKYVKLVEYVKSMS
jgi:hypothetical protein